MEAVLWACGIGSLVCIDNVTVDGSSSMDFEVYKAIVSALTQLK